MDGVCNPSLVEDISKEELQELKVIYEDANQLDEALPYLLFFKPDIRSIVMKTLMKK